MAESLRAVRIGHLAHRQAAFRSIGGKYAGWIDVIIAAEANGVIHQGDLHVQIFTDGDHRYEDDRVGDYRHPLLLDEKLNLIQSREGQDQLSELIYQYFGLRLPARSSI